MDRRRQLHVRARAEENRVKRASPFLVCLLCACGSKPQATPTTDAAADVVVVDAASSDSSVTIEPSWVELVRDERWTAAAGAIDALPDAERTKPEVRFARAVVAIARADGKTAVTSLENLEAGLPALGAEIGRARAKAQAIAGPFTDAGEWFEKHAASNDDHVAAANAFMKAKLPTRATAEAMRVISAEHKTHAQEVEARGVRMHTGEISDTVADARWLLVHGDLGQAKDAETVLAKDDPKHPLVQKEFLARAAALADAGQLEEALHVLERAGTAPQATAIPSVLRRARADAMMRARGRYTDAASLFRQCTLDPASTQPASDLVWSARALSRADRDDDAIERYGEVIARFPKSSEAAAATFFSGRLELLHGRWEKAAARLDEYAAKFASGADHEEAMHLRAIAHFEKGDEVKHARALLEQRAGSERDPVARARMENLAAQAALKDGDRTHAIARFSDVVRSLPLSWPALVARARLVQLGAPVPPAIPAPPVATASPLVVTLPEAVATLYRIGLDGAAEEALRARESEVTAATPSRSVEALCIAYGKIDRARRRMSLSLQASASYLQNAPSDATRWAWSCAYPTPFASAVRDAEIRETLPEGLLDAVMRQESAFDTSVISPARAVGVLQMLPETGAAVAHEMGIHLDDGDLKSPSRSVTLGSRHLHDLLIRSRGSVPLAVASYNAGADSVLRWAQRMKGMEIDAFVEAIPFGETRGYVVRVMENLARYGFLAHGEEGVPKIDLAIP